MFSMLFYDYANTYYQLIGFANKQLIGSYTESLQRNQNKPKYTKLDLIRSPPDFLHKCIVIAHVTEIQSQSVLIIEAFCCYRMDFDLFYCIAIVISYYNLTLNL